MVTTDSLWKVIEAMIDIFWCVDMKLNRIMCTKHVLIVLIHMFLHMLCEAKVTQVFKFSLGAERKKCKNGGYCYHRMCVDPPIVTQVDIGPKTIICMCIKRVFYKRN